MKKLGFNILIAISGLLLLTQCKKEGSYATEKEINGESLIHCDVATITDSLNLQLSDLVDNCELIRLESTDESYFKSTQIIRISDNYIAIKSTDYPPQPVKLFNRKGKFICNIGNIGKGEGEYNSLYDIQLDEKVNRIYLTPFANVNYIMAFNLQGEYQNIIRLKHTSPKCKTHIHNDIITVLSMVFNDKTPLAYQQKTDGTIINELPSKKHLILRRDYSSEISSDYNDAAFDQYIMAWGKETPDTLYHYLPNSNKLIPKFVLTNGPKRIGSWPRELKNHFYSYIWDKQFKNKKVLVDKRTLKTNFFTLQNDFLGGIELKQFYMSNNGWFVATKSTLNLIEEIQKVLDKEEISQNERSKLKELYNTLEPNDNEVLFIGKMI